MRRRVLLALLLSALIARGCLAAEEAVVFEPRSSKLTAESKLALDRVVRAWKAAATAQVRIAGEGDTVSSFATLRLRLIEEELERRGVPPDHILPPRMAGTGARFRLEAFIQAAPERSPARWEARAGQSLQAVLAAWGRRAGWTVVWHSDRDYPIEAQAAFDGDFIAAASALIAAFAAVLPVPRGQFYKGNSVLVVTAAEGG